MYRRTRFPYTRSWRLLETVRWLCNWFDPEQQRAAQFSRLFSSRNVEFDRFLMMKEKNTTSILKRVLMNCGSQAKQYGSCVASKVPEVEHDMCSKEFLLLTNCMQNVLRGKK